MLAGHTKENMEPFYRALPIILLCLICFILGRRTAEEKIEYVEDVRRFDSVFSILKAERAVNIEVYNQIRQYESTFDSMVDSVIRSIRVDRPLFSDVQARGVDTGRYNTRNIIADFHSAKERFGILDTGYWHLRRIEIRDSLERVFSTGELPSTRITD